MPSLAREAGSVYTVAELPKDRAYALCRFMALPDGGDVAECVRAVQGHYWTYTGRELPVWDAIRLYDRLNAERYGVPFPAAYSRIAEALFREDYSVEAIHAVIGHLRRGGTIASCPHLETAERATVAELLPRDAKQCRCQVPRPTSETE